MPKVFVVAELEEAPKNMAVVVGVKGFVFGVLEVLVAASIGVGNADKVGEATTGNASVEEVTVTTNDSWGKW